jgi:hypothetical protein
MGDYERRRERSPAGEDSGDGVGNSLMVRNIGRAIT